jgi:two-component system response regulator CpxR
MSDRLLGLRVLLVDASDDRRHVLRRQLQGEGATVLEAAGGQDALRLAAADCFDVAVIELALPDVCDEGLITLLAAVARSGVLVTMSASPRQDQARAIIAGAARFYARPVDWDELVRYLEWISPGGSAPSGTRPRTPAQ